MTTLEKLTDEIDHLLGGEIKNGRYIIEIYGYTNRGERALVGPGRPINLEDVMRAINNKIPYEYYSEEDGRRIISTEYGDVIDMWDWGKPLSSQSYETVERIAEILGI